MLDFTSEFMGSPSNGTPHRLPWSRSGGKEFDFSDLAPAGFYVAACTSFSLPVASLNTLPKDWIAEYSRHGLMLQDPAMKWLYANSGVSRLIDIKFDDFLGMSARAARHGLRYGAAVSHGVPSKAKTHSYGIFYRSDRDFADAELELLEIRVRHLHNLSSPESNWAPLYDRCRRTS